MAPSLLLSFALAMTMQDTTDRWAPLARVIEAGIAERAFPGAVVAIGRRDTVLYLRAFGQMTYGEDGSEGSKGSKGSEVSVVSTRTVYDLASLTKVVGLTTAIMMLVDEGKVDLDAPVSRYVPEFGATHDSTITVRRLLTHSSGLPAWRPMYQTARDRRGMFALAEAEPLEYPTGTRMVYSDLGAITLTDMVERITGQRIDRFLEARLFRPLGMRDTRYGPPRSWRSRIAPTEVDTTWRHRLVHGEVHDENAAKMDGVSGHAGLFGTAPDLVRFAQMVLAGSGEQGAGSVQPQLVRPETVREFTRRQDAALSSRALGWDTPSENSSAGSRMSARAFGHTGFTGTSMWMDPEQDLFVILLTNRVHPTRENAGIHAVRRAVADAAVEGAQAR
jgi:CubicO group peptidase (beta-lactamase class C family)